MAKSLGGAILRGVGGVIVGGASYKASELREEAKAARARSLEGFRQEGRMELQVAGDTAMEGRAVGAFERAAGEKIAGYDPETYQPITRKDLEGDPSLGRGMLSEAQAKMSMSDAEWQKTKVREQEAFDLGTARERRAKEDNYQRFVDEGGTKGWSAKKIAQHKASVMTGIPQPEIAKLKVSDDDKARALEFVQMNAPKGTPQGKILEDAKFMALEFARLGQIPLSRKDRPMGDILSKENPTGTELPKPSQKLVTTVTRAKAGNYGAKQDLKKLMPDLIDELGREGAEALIDSIGESKGMLDTSASDVKTGSTGDIIQPQPLGEDYAPYELYGSKGIGR